MPEPTLSLKLSDFEAGVGHFLGYGRGADFDQTAWTTSQQDVIDFCVQSGLRNFYFPAPVSGYTHSWSFLKPVVTLSLASGASTVDLPSDSGGVEGCVTSTSTTVMAPIQVVGIGQVYEKHQQYPDTTGYPIVACVEPIKSTSGIQGQSLRLKFWPTSDAAYTLQVQTYINPDYLTSKRPYAYGGPEHAETILESCLAIAEQRLDDSMEIHTAKFQERLATSISMDRRKKAQTLGPNIDRSDWQETYRGWPSARNDCTVTFAGASY